MATYVNAPPGGLFGYRLGALCALVVKNQIEIKPIRLKSNQNLCFICAHLWLKKTNQKQTDSDLFLL